MVELVRGHGLDEGQVIRLFCEVGQGIGKEGAGLSVALEFVRGSHELGDTGCKGEAFSLEEFIRAVLAFTLDQLGLVVTEKTNGEKR